MAERRRLGSSGSRWDPGLASTLGGGSLKIDMGYVERQPLFGTARMSSAALGPWKVTEMLVVDRNEVSAGKLAALFGRTIARDLFDGRSIKDSFQDLDRKGIKAAFLMFVAASRTDWRSLETAATEANLQKVREHLDSCLPAGYLDDAGGDVAWFNESVEMCRECLAFLMDLTEGERESLDGVQIRGEVNTEPLNASTELRALISTAPRLVGKCRSVLEQRGAQAFSLPAARPGRRWGSDAAPRSAPGLPAAAAGTAGHKGSSASPRPRRTGRIPVVRTRPRAVRAADGRPPGPVARKNPAAARIPVSWSTTSATRLLETIPVARGRRDGGA